MEIKRKRGRAAGPVSDEQLLLATAGARDHGDPGDERRVHRKRIAEHLGSPTARQRPSCCDRSSRRWRARGCSRPSGGGARTTGASRRKVRGVSSRFGIEKAREPAGVSPASRLATGQGDPSPVRRSLRSPRSRTGAWPPVPAGRHRRGAGDAGEQSACDGAQRGNGGSENGHLRPRPARRRAP